jgi:hypothetical protein
MQRFKLDDDLPLENRMVSNIIEGRSTASKARTSMSASTC